MANLAELRDQVASGAITRRQAREMLPARQRKGAEFPPSVKVKSFRRGGRMKMRPYMREYFGAESIAGYSTRKEGGEMEHLIVVDADGMKPVYLTVEQAQFIVDNQQAFMETLKEATA